MKECPANGVMASLTNSFGKWVHRTYVDSEGLVESAREGQN